MSAGAVVAVVLGGTGSVGQHVVEALLNAPWCARVVMVSRRPLDQVPTREGGWADPSSAAADGRVDVRVVESLESIDASHVAGARGAFCTLGHGAARSA